MNIMNSLSDAPPVSGKGVFSPFFFCALLLVWFFFPAALPAAVVGNVEVKGLYSIEREELLHLLGISPGETINEEIIRSGIKRAFMKGVFEDIAVETKGEKKTDVFVHVTERDFIEKITLKGNFSVSGKTLREMLHLKEEGFLLCDMVEKAAADLKPKLAQLGYPRASIRAEVERLEEPYRVNISLFIETGTPEVIQSIKISGVAEELKESMKLSEGDVYDQFVIKKDIARIRALLKKQGYYRPLISSYSFSEGVLSIAVNPGRKLRVSIEGNEEVSEKTLMHEIPFFTVEDFNDDIVQEAVYRMISFYYKNGYPFAQIAPVVTEEDGSAAVRFFVFEGPEVKVGSIAIRGSSFSEKRLRNVLSLKEGRKYNPDLIEADKGILKNFYYALGYLSVSVDDFETSYDESSRQMKLVITINEGEKTTIGQVSVTGAAQIAPEEIKRVIRLKPGDPYNEVDIADARYRIIELYSNRGFPDVKVVVQREIEGTNASLGFTINEGAKVFFGKTIITGNSRTKYHIIRRELKEKEGLPFDYSMMTQERQKLYRLGLFSDVELRALNENEQERDILVRLRESDAGTVEFGVGYTDYERIRGFMDVSYRNLWGMNKQASLRLELSTIEQRYLFQYYEPWFLEKPIPFRLFLLGEKRREIDIDTRDVRYRLTRYGANAGTEKTLGKNIKAELYYEFSLVKTYDVKPDVILSKEDTGTLVISGVRLGLIYDTRDNPFYPSKGVLAGVSTKLTTPVFLSETDFAKLMMHFNIYQKLITGIVLAASVRGGIAEGYNDTRELPIVERFFLGGRTTVRGYEQDTLGPKGADGNPTGGNAFLMENVEIRASVTRNLGIVAFLDGGNVWVKVEDMDLSDFRFTAGLGVRYNTPVGPIRIDYGRKLQKEKGESRGELHFSIGHAF